MTHMDVRSAQSTLARVWRLCWAPYLQDGNMMSREGAQQWECPWCRYSLAFWPSDTASAEGFVQDHLIRSHHDQLQSLSCAAGQCRVRMPEDNAP